MVSNMGRLKSLNYCNKNREGLIKPGQNRKGGNGYLYLCASDRTSGRRENIYVHRLVAELWVPNATGKPCVNHLDEDVTNNRFDNLAWCTVKENINYGNHNKRISESRKGMKCPWNWKAVKQFSLNGRFIKEWASMKKAAESVNPADKFLKEKISQCCRGIIKAAGGFVWKYVSPCGS